MNNIDINKIARRIVLSSTNIDKNTALKAVEEIIKRNETGINERDALRIIEGAVNNHREAGAIDWIKLLPNFKETTVIAILGFMALFGSPAESKAADQYMESHNIDKQEIMQLVKKSTEKSIALKEKNDNKNKSHDKSVKKEIFSVRPIAGNEMVNAVSEITWAIVGHIPDNHISNFTGDKAARRNYYEKIISNFKNKCWRMAERCERDKKNISINAIFEQALSSCNDKYMIEKFQEAFKEYASKSSHGINAAYNTPIKDNSILKWWDIGGEYYLAHYDEYGNKIDDKQDIGSPVIVLNPND